MKHNRVPTIVITAPELLANDGRLLRQKRLLEAENYQVIVLGPLPESTKPDLMPGARHIDWQAPLAWLGLEKWPSMLRKYLNHAVQMAAWVKALRKIKPDLIIASAPEALKAAALSHQGLIIYDTHEFYEDEFGDKGRSQWVRRTHHQFGKSIDGLMTVSKGLASLYSEHWPNWPSAHLYLNAAPFSKPVYDNRLHDSLGLKPDTRIWLFHGSLGAHRGLETLGTISQYLPFNHVIVVMGDGALKSQLESEQNEKLRLLPSVAYDELPLWLAGASLGLLFYEPISLNQIFCAPNKLFEYAALSVPILAYDLPGLREYEDSGIKISFVNPWSSPEDIVAGALSVIEGAWPQNEPQLEVKSDLSYQVQSLKFLDFVKATLKSDSLGLRSKDRPIQDNQ